MVVIILRLRILGYNDVYVGEGHYHIDFAAHPFISILLSLLR